jgi:hypothetical protein
VSKPVPKEFESKGIVHSGLLVLPPQVALEFVRYCRKENLELVSVDGFRLLPQNVIQPDLENSLSLFRRVYDSWTLKQQFDAAEKFLEERLGTDLFFDVTTV